MAYIKAKQITIGTVNYFEQQNSKQLKTSIFSILIFVLSIYNKVDLYLSQMPIKNTALVLFMTLLTAVYITNYDHFSKQMLNRAKFEQWKHQYGIRFESQQEDAYRLMIFVNNKKEVMIHNANLSHTYKKGINQFSALSSSQFILIHLKHIQTPTKNISSVDLQSPQILSSIDWRALGKVSPVKNQGKCLSCWAFSAVGVLQSFSLISSNLPLHFSEQQLVDCSDKYGNSGCLGGLNQNALTDVKERGIVQQYQYVYTGQKGKCLRHGGAYKIKGVGTYRGCKQLAKGIMLQPLGVTVDAATWHSYSSGVLNNCGQAINHDLLLVGITSSFYLLKNSWGTTWGEQGYIRMALGNTCGICIESAPFVF